MVRLHDGVKDVASWRCRLMADPLILSQEAGVRLPVSLQGDIGQGLHWSLAMSPSRREVDSIRGTIPVG